MCVTYVPGTEEANVVLDPLELELKTVVHATWLLGTEIRLSERAASALTRGDLSPAP